MFAWTSFSTSALRSAEATAFVHSTTKIATNRCTPRPYHRTVRAMLQEKVIVITGASRGIGEAIARACVDGGARVALASRKQADLDKVVASLPAERAIAIACHTGKAEEVDAMMAKAIEKFGRVDGLVN